MKTSSQQVINTFQNPEGDWSYRGAFSVEITPDANKFVVPVSAKDKQGKWMENSQTEPEIKVKNMPGKIDQGIDEQLLRAIEEMKKTIE